MGIRISEQGKTYSHFIQLEPLDFFCKKEEKQFCTSILGYRNIEDSCYKEVEVRDSDPDA